MSIAMNKYRSTQRYKEVNNRCSKRFYSKNKKKILEKHRQRVECFFCGNNYNTQYFQREHFLCCPALN